MTQGLTSKVRINPKAWKEVISPKPKPRSYKGFHVVNPRHDPRVFSSWEKAFSQKLNGFTEKHDIRHETRLNGIYPSYKTGRFCFWVDFLVPHKRLTLEVNPQWHYIFKEVVDRDRARRIILKEKFGIETVDITKEILESEEKLNEIKRLIDNAPVSPFALDYYLRGEEA